VRSFNSRAALSVKQEPSLQLCIRNLGHRHPIQALSLPQSCSYAQHTFHGGITVHHCEGRHNSRLGPETQQINGVCSEDLVM
jgi:hypothetical protein